MDIPTHNSYIIKGIIFVATIVWGKLRVKSKTVQLNTMWAFCLWNVLTMQWNITFKYKNF